MSIAGIRHGFERAGGGSSVVPDRRVGFWFRDDFENLLKGTFGIAGTGANSNNNNFAAGRPGTVNAQVTAVATPDRAAYEIAASGNKSSGLGGGPWSYEVALNPQTLSNGVDNYTLRVGFADQVFQATDFSNAVYFELDYGNHANSNNWFCKTAKANARTTVDSTIAAAAVTWVRLRIEVDSAGANCTYKINDVVVATINTNVPVLSLSHGYQLLKQLGAGQLTVTFDYIEVMQTFASSR